MKPHEEWLLKAEHDLQAAVLLAEKHELLDTSIYHTQQCAEKALKGFLVFHEKELCRTHHLKPLLEECMLIDTSFAELIEDAIFLSPFATEFRYPDDYCLPDPEDVKKALDSASRVYSFVKIKTDF